MLDQRFTKRHRLLRPSEFRRVFDARAAAAQGALRLFGAPSTLGHARLGLAVSRKVGNAVVRNRWKRALREAFRLVQQELPALDLVCIPRGNGPPNVRQLSNQLQTLAGQLERKTKGRGEE